MEAIQTQSEEPASYKGCLLERFEEAASKRRDKRVKKEGENKLGQPVSNSL